MNRRIDALLIIITAFVAQPSLAMTLGFSASATCQIGIDVIEIGGAGFPAADCADSRNTGGLFPEMVDVKTKALARAAPLSVGVTLETSVDAPDVFIDTYASEASATATFSSSFEIAATYAGGTMMPGGFFTVEAVLTGQMMLSSFGIVVNSLTTGELTYQFVIGPSFSTDTLTVTPPNDFRAIVVPISVVVPWEAAAALPVNMSVNATASATLFGDGFASTDVEFGNSLEWLGITNVTDASGVEAASFTALGADGIDFAGAPVPVPAALWLLLGALVPFAFGHSNRRY